VPIPDGDRLLDWGQALDRPLETERQLMLNDAAGVIRSLAQDYLPQNHSLNVP